MEKADASVEKFLSMETLPDYNLISSLLSDVCKVLSSESSSYRPVNCIDETGSLLEFKEPLSTVIVPDLHARPDFIENILSYNLPEDFCGVECTVQQALKNKKINVICVGDAIHTELFAQRWKSIMTEFEEGNYSGKMMKEEMLLGLSTLCGIIKLKIDYPENFHFLKGNHENILNLDFGGDYSFCKYADEGEMVKLFIGQYYDEELLQQISQYENLLPLIAAGKNYVVSHAEPADFFTREQLIDAKFEENVVEGLIWTKNGQVTEDTCKFIMNELLGKTNAKKAFYFAGHRPVKENYSTRQNGVFVQLHNPHKQNIALIYKDKKFDAEKDIVNTKE